MEALGTSPLIEFEVSDKAPRGPLGESGFESLPIHYNPLYVDYQNEYYLSKTGAKNHRFLKMFSGSQLVGLATLNRLEVDFGARHESTKKPILELSHIVFDQRFTKELKVCAITEGARYLGTLENDVAERTLIVVNQRLSDPVMALLVEKSEFSPTGVSAEFRIDLRNSEEELFGRLRKKHRQQIRKHRDTLHVSVRTDGEALDELQRLHFQVAGGHTRSLTTWGIQRKSVEGGSAFVVTISSPANELLGALYVMHAPEEAISFSAAYDRLAMAEGYPLGHLAEWEAIKFLKKNNLGKSYVLWGISPNTVRDQKFANILKFKQGFAPSYDLVGRLQHVHSDTSS